MGWSTHNPPPSVLFANDTVAPMTLTTGKGNVTVLPGAVVPLDEASIVIARAATKQEADEAQLEADVVRAALEEKDEV